MDISMEARVVRSVALLDQLRGKGWERDIDVEQLDMSYSLHCVLGQLYGHLDRSMPYTAGVAALGMDHESARNWYAFDLSDADWDAIRATNVLDREPLVAEAYARLRAAWVAAIELLK